MIAVIGEILVDIFKDGEEETVLPGGAPFNVAVILLILVIVGFIRCWHR